MALFSKSTLAEYFPSLSDAQDRSPTCQLIYTSFRISAIFSSDPPLLSRCISLTITSLILPEKYNYLNTTSIVVVVRKVRNERNRALIFYSDVL